MARKRREERMLEKDVKKLKEERQRWFRILPIPTVPN